MTPGVNQRPRLKGFRIIATSLMNRGKMLKTIFKHFTLHSLHLREGKYMLFLSTVSHEFTIPGMK